MVQKWGKRGTGDRGRQEERYRKTMEKEQGGRERETDRAWEIENEQEGGG